jgi:mannose-6-phosphate isomerase-like protein (cupin superfamily)
MDPRFEDVFTSPENSIFKVVFYPDRIYHAAYLNATRSPRYRYNVREVRSKLDITVMKGEVYLDGLFLCNFLRLEYRSGRIVEESRQRGRVAQDQLMAYIRLIPDDPAPGGDAIVKLHLCPWTDSYQVEFWETLEPPANVHHDFTVLDQMGRDAPITRVRAFGPALKDIKTLRRIELAFRENDKDWPNGFKINNPEWDNNYFSSHQEPRTDTPSSGLNTVEDRNYLIDFRRGWFFHTDDVKPVRYLNALMEPGNPDIAPDNIIEMKWLVQREFGTSVVFFHEVTIPPGKTEGTHRHVGSEELYYICEGTGIAYMGEGDDPSTDGFPTVERTIFGLGKKRCKELPVRPGNIIYTKSGGIHGIRNNTDKPLRFVAFLYHST